MTCGSTPEAICMSAKSSGLQGAIALNPQPGQVVVDCTVGWAASWLCALMVELGAAKGS
jgi:hypothetical protein